MSTVPMLVRTPAPHATESLWGYVLRLSEVNGYETPNHVLAVAGLNTVRGKSSRFPTSRLAPIVGRSAGEFEHLSYGECSTEDTSSFKLLGQPAGRSYRHSLLNLRTPAFCPHCVTEDGFLDAFWDLWHVVACPRHHCALLRQCSACGDALSWYRQGLLTCRCGNDLRNEQTPRIAIEVAELMQVLRNKAHGKPLNELDNKSKYPLADFEAMALEPFALMLTALAHSTRSDTDRKKAMLPADVIKTGAAALSNWPHGYHTMLHRIGNEVGSTLLYTSGLNVRFQYFNSAMFKTRPYSDQYDFLRREYLRFGCQEWGDSVVDERSLKGESYDRRFVSQNQLAKQLGVTRATVSAWAKEGLLTLKEINTGSVKRYIADANQVLIPKRTPGKTLGVQEAASIVGLPKEVLLELRRLGVYRVRNLPSRKDAFHEKDIAYFREQLLERTTLLDSAVTPTPSAALTLYKVLNHFKGFSVADKARFVVEYLAGDVKSLGRFSDSVRDILFDEGEARAFIYKDALVGMSHREAARRLGCKEDTVPKLISDGHIEAAIADQEELLVNHASVQRFASRYVSLSRLSDELNVPISRLRRLADASEIVYLRAGGDWQAKGGAPFISHDDVLRLKAQVERTKSWAEGARTSDDKFPRN